MNSASDAGGSGDFDVAMYALVVEAALDSGRCRLIEDLLTSFGEICEGSGAGCRSGRPSVDVARACQDGERQLRLSRFSTTSRNIPRLSMRLFGSIASSTVDFIQIPSLSPLKQGFVMAWRLL